MICRETKKISAHHRGKSDKGFTLMELVVVAGIFVIVSAVVLANNNRFGGMMSLQNLAYDIALSVRQAQVYGISVRRVGASEFKAGYGMHFDIADKTHYELFADLTGNSLFDASAGENVPPSPYIIGRDFRIADLCVTSGGTETCSAGGIQTIDILFRRPEPDAFIRSNSAPSLKDRARIVVESPRGDRLSIVIETTGGISVQKN